MLETIKYNKVDPVI